MRAEKSETLLVLYSARACSAFSSAVCASAALSPLLGTLRETVEPRNVARNCSRSSESSGSDGTRTSFGIDGASTPATGE